MFIWGKGHKTIDLPSAAQVYCHKCGSTSDHTATVDYDYDHIFWLFKGLKNKVTTTQCGNCQHVESLEGTAQKEFFAKKGGNPIPFMDRYGGHVLLLLILAYVAFALSSPCAINPNSQACAESKLSSE